MLRFPIHLIEAAGGFTVSGSRRNRGFAHGRLASKPDVSPSLYIMSCIVPRTCSPLPRQQITKSSASLTMSGFRHCSARVPASSSMYRLLNGELSGDPCGLPPPWSRLRVLRCSFRARRFPQPQLQPHLDQMQQRSVDNSASRRPEKDGVDRSALRRLLAACRFAADTGGASRADRLCLRVRHSKRPKPTPQKTHAEILDRFGGAWARSEAEAQTLGVIRCAVTGGANSVAHCVGDADASTTVENPRPS